MKPLLCLLIASITFAATAEAAEPAPALEQVIVEGKRKDLVKLAKDVLLAEQRFYQRYNELNKVAKYQVNCYNEAQTGSRFKRQYCQPVYETEADRTEARDFMLALGRGTPAGSVSAGMVGGVMAMGGSSGPGGSAAATTTGDSGGTAPPAASGGTVAAFVEVESGRPGFQKNVREVTLQHPDLAKLLQEHTAAVERYEALFRKVNSDAPAPAKSP
jgi:hypothetical protein